MPTNRSVRDGPNELGHRPISLNPSEGSMHDQNGKHNSGSSPGATLSSVSLPRDDLPAVAECSAEAAERGGPSDSDPFNDLRFVDHIYQRRGRANDRIWSC